MFTYSDKLILGSSGKILAIRAEADASDVKVSGKVDVLILQDAELLASLHIVDLSRTVAAGGNVLAIHAEPHAANNALMLESMDQLNIQYPGNSCVEDDPPIILHLLDMIWEAVRIKFAQSVGLSRRGWRLVVLSHPGVVRGRMGWDLRRLSRAAVIRDRSVDLGSSRAASGRSTDAALAARSRRSSALGWLRREVTRSLGSLILLLEGRLLGRRRGRGRRTLQPGGRRHMCRLLLLLRWRGGRDQCLCGSSLTCHDGTKNVGSQTDSRRLPLSRMLWGWIHASRIASAGFKLPTKQRNLILVPGHIFVSIPLYQVSGMIDQLLTILLLLDVHLVLLHLEDFLANNLKLLELRCHCCLVSRVHTPKPRVNHKPPALSRTTGLPHRQRE